MLLCGFLDVENAYDSVPHVPLFSCMSADGLPPQLLSTIQRLYSRNVVTAQLGTAVSDPTVVTKSIRQGCLLSPLLFVLYVSRLERALLKSNLGFSLWFSTTSASENHCMPTLAFAGDLVVMAENSQDLQTR